MARATAMAMADGNATEMAVAMVGGNCNGNGWWHGQRQWAMATATAMELAMVMETAMAIGMATAMAKVTMTKGGLPLHVQFTEWPSVCPPHYSGTQKLCQPIDALPPPLLFHIFAKVSLGGAWIKCLQHAALWHG
jgi:hypothetical protein